MRNKRALATQIVIHDTKNTNCRWIAANFHKVRQHYESVKNSEWLREKSNIVFSHHSWFCCLQCVDVAFKLLKIAQKEIKHYIQIKIAAMFLWTLYEKNKTSKKLLTNSINHGII